MIGTCYQLRSRPERGNDIAGPAKPRPEQPGVRVPVLGGMITAYDAEWRGGCRRPVDGLGLAGGAGLLVPRDAVDDAIAAAGKQAKRSDGKLPPHVMVYFVMALALFADDDYEEVAARLTETLASWGCWDDRGACRPRAGSPRPASGWDLSRCGSCSAEVAAPVRRS